MSESKYLASASDGKEILRILESSAAKGSIELIYTRRPDAYESYMKESGEARVFISRDGARAIGTCAEVIREVYIGGEVCRAAYICGLKKDAEYDGGVAFDARLIRDLRRDDIHFYFCSVVADNTHAQKMFEKSRRLLDMKQTVGYKTYILSPKVKINEKKHGFTFRRATENDRETLIGFLNAEGKKKDLFPVIKTLDEFYNLSIEDFYLLLDGEHVVASAALWDQTDYKQYVVKKYRGVMRLARMANPILSALRYIQLPKENQPLAFPMLSFLISRNDNPEYYRIMLAEIKKVIAGSYDMFVIGLPREHFAAPMLDKLPSISFETKLYAIRFPWSEQAYKLPDPQKSFLECGLL